MTDKGKNDLFEWMLIPANFREIYYQAEKNFKEYLSTLSEKEAKTVQKIYHRQERQGIRAHLRCLQKAYTDDQYQNKARARMIKEDISFLERKLMEGD
jgi:hypothetical protein